jgi:predicted butyrate kinase (DUF1464 family)
MSVNVEEEVFYSVQTIRMVVEMLRRRARDKKNDNLQEKMHEMMETFLKQISAAVNDREQVKELVNGQKKELLTLKNEISDKKLEDVIKKARDKANSKVEIKEKVRSTKEKNTKTRQQK